MDFTSVIDLLNMLFCFSQAIEFTAYLKLKREYPNMPKPWRIPLPDWLIVVMLVVPIGFTSVIIYFSSAQALIISSLLTALGFAVYDLMERARANEWAYFERYVPWCDGMKEKLEFTLAQ